MAIILDGNIGVTYPDVTTQNTSAIISGKLPTTRLPAGSILQTLTATDLTERSTTSTSFVTASNTLSVTITPTLATSRFFVCVTTTGYKNTNDRAVYTIYRGATNLGNSVNGMQVIPNENYFPVAMSILDSPNTTSPTTYQVYFRMTGGTGNAYLTAGLSGAGNFSSMTVFEIAG